MTIGKKINGGKTKSIKDAGNGCVFIDSKNDITAGDGLRHDVLEGKAAASTRTTCNIFKLLEKHGIRTHFVRQVDDTTFVARHLNMIKLELVARRFASGSYLKRFPEVAKGTVFDELVFEIFEKDDTLSPPEAKDDTRNDPYVEFDFDRGVMRRWKPKQPMAEGFIDERSLAETSVPFMTPELRERLRELTLRSFLVLEEAWDKLGWVYIDFKIECGFDRETGELLVGDVIDSDSGRLEFDGKDMSKQSYRDGSKPLSEIGEDFKMVARLTDSFV